MYGYLAQVSGGQGPSQPDEHVYAGGKVPPLLRGRPMARAAGRRRRASHAELYQAHLPLQNRDGGDERHRDPVFSDGQRPEKGGDLRSADGVCGGAVGKGQAGQQEMGRCEKRVHYRRPLSVLLRRAHAQRERCHGHDPAAENAADRQNGAVFGRRAGAEPGGTGMDHHRRARTGGKRAQAGQRQRAARGGDTPDRIRRGGRNAAWRDGRGRGADGQRQMHEPSVHAQDGRRRCVLPLHTGRCVPAHANHPRPGRLPGVRHALGRKNGQRPGRGRCGAADSEPDRGEPHAGAAGHLREAVQLPHGGVRPGQAAGAGEAGRCGGEHRREKPEREPGGQLCAVPEPRAHQRRRGEFTGRACGHQPGAGGRGRGRDRTGGPHEGQRRGHQGGPRPERHQPERAERGLQAVCGGPGDDLVQAVGGVFGAGAAAGGRHAAAARGAGGAGRRHKNRHFAHRPVQRAFPRAFAGKRAGAAAYHI